MSVLCSFHGYYSIVWMHHILYRIITCGNLDWVHFEVLINNAATNICVLKDLCGYICTFQWMLVRLGHLFNIIYITHIYIICNQNHLFSSKNEIDLYFHFKTKLLNCFYKMSMPVYVPTDDVWMSGLLPFFTNIWWYRHSDGDLLESHWNHI